MTSEYERKLIDMQYQMRENNAYLNDYLRDLDSWTDDIKRKEKDLNKSEDTVSKDLPPIRNFVEPKRPKKKSKTKTSPKDKPSTIRAYDYRSWDKFDVEAECAKVDDEETNNDNDGADADDDEDEDDEQWQEEVLKKKAEYFKECGNYQFKAKSYAVAIENYTKAIECDPTCPIYFANRAQCQLFEQRYGACEADCTLAIQLDKNYLKAYYRRALARLELEKYEKAREDLEYILSREPLNQDAKAKLDEVNKKDEIKRLGRVYPLSEKPLGQRSTRPLKRIEIQEIDTSVITSSSETKKQKNIIIEEFETPIETSDKTEDSKIQVTADKTTASTISSTVQSPPAVVTSKPSTVSVPVPVSVPKAVPTTGYQFKRDWSNLNNQVDEQFVYFNKIPPKSYKTIFSSGLDSSIFSRILLFWSTKSDFGDSLVDSMYELRQAPRFSTQLSFLNNDDKNSLKTILEKLKTNFSSNEKVQTILHEYNVD